MNLKRFAALLMLTVIFVTLPLKVCASGAEIVTGDPTVTAGTNFVGTTRTALPTFDVPAKAALLMARDTGEILYSKNSDDRLPIASITKVMTLLLTMEALDAGKIALTDLVPVSEHAYSMGGSQIWLEPGEQFTLDELLKAICIASANDAAVAVAEYVGGSEPVFAEMMNQKAKELGMSQSNFKNACGLDIEGHFSSALDVALMSRELLTRHPQITQYTTIWMDSLRGGATELTNTNKLLKRYAGINGLKTGTTGLAGVCISASAEREGLGLISVVLGSASSADRFAAATALLDYGFANFESAVFPPLSAYPKMLRVKNGSEQEVPLCYDVPETLLLKKGEGTALQTTVQIPAFSTAPIENGTVLGTVTLAVGGEILGEYPITAEQTIPKMDFKHALELLLKAMITL